MSWQRRCAETAGKALGLVFARKGMAWDLIEPEQLERFLAAFQVDCVFDVGANTGQYAQRLRHIGFRGLILSFEPNPDTASVLRDAARRDALWVVQELALDERSGLATFNVMRSSQFSSLHEPDHSNTADFIDLNCIARKIEVTAQTIENLFPVLQSQYGFRRPFLKMDTQGHDLAVARGAGPHLGDFVGLQSELSLTQLYAQQPSFTEALEFYRSAGFRLSALVPNNAGHFPDLNEVDCIMYNLRTRLPC